jgi:flavin-dependent dehydrogenase
LSLPLAGATEDVDVVIAGAGPSGSAAAITLRKLGRSVQLVDITDGLSADRRRSFGETLVPAALVLLEQLGVREAFFAANPLPCHSHWSAWGRPDSTERYSITDPYGPGWFVDRLTFDKILKTRALQLGARDLHPGRLSILNRGPEHEADTARLDKTWELSVSRNSARDQPPIRFRARFLIDATGRGARVVRQLGATRHMADNLAAVAMELEGSSLDGAATHVETAEEGWWYASSGAQGKVCVVLMTDADLIRSMRAVEPDGFHARFARTRTSKRFELATPSVGHPTPVVSAASTGFTSNLVGNAWAAVGDAAVSLDPLSSRGISAALLSGTHAGHAAHTYLSGTSAGLASYATTLQRVYTEHLATQRAFYLMERRFSSEPFWQRRTGNYGLESAEAATVAES